MPGLLAAITAALVIPASFAGAALGLCGLAGRRNGWLDVAAQFAPVWLVFSVAGAILGWPILEQGAWLDAVLFAALVGIAANGLLVIPEFLQGQPGPTGETAPPLRMLTFNIWSENPDPAGTVEAILRADADIIALQEIRTLKPDQRARLAEAYPHWIVSSADGGDLVIASRRPWTTTNPRLPTQGGRLAMAWGETTAPDGAPVQVLTTHYRHPMPPGPQAAQRGALARAVQALEANDLILTGDFNLAPWSAALRRQDRALAPLARRTRALFTWPARMARPRHQPLFPVLAIDHIYAGPAWRALAVSRLPRTGSDHYGVLAVLARAPTSAKT